MHRRGDHGRLLVRAHHEAEEKKDEGWKWIHGAVASLWRFCTLIHQLRSIERKDSRVVEVANTCRLNKHATEATTKEHDGS